MVDRITNTNGENPKCQQISQGSEIKFSARDIDIFNGNVAQNDATRVVKPSIFAESKLSQQAKMERAQDQFDLSESSGIGLTSAIVSKKMGSILSRETSSFVRKKIVENYMKYINAGNFKTILNGYQQKNKESLTTSIINSNVLSDKEKKSYLNDLLKKAEEHAAKNKKYAGDILPQMRQIVKEYNEKSNISDVDKKRMGADMQRLTLRRDTTGTVAPKNNGELDEVTKQGSTGDCWLLSGLKSLSLTPDGKKILKQSLKVNPKTGDVTVTLRGVGKSYVVTKQEIKNATDLSKGDDDMRALELATNRYYRESANDGKVDIWGGTGAMTFALFTGKKGVAVVRDKKAISAGINKFAASKGSVAAVTSMHRKKPFEIHSTVDGKHVDLFNSHAYTLQKVEGNFVYLVNPHDTSKPIKVPRNEYLANFDSLCTKDFNGD